LGSNDLALAPDGRKSFLNLPMGLPFLPALGPFLESLERPRGHFVAVVVVGGGGGRTKVAVLVVGMKVAVAAVSILRAKGKLKGWHRELAGRWASVALLPSCARQLGFGLHFSFTNVQEYTWFSATSRVMF
jgi:hypothetical protein